MAAGWDAFLSYARADSERSATALQRGLERFARPWYQRRAIRVFRDNAAMSTNPALWPAIERGLTGASHLIVLLSPSASRSEYVERETRWWVEHKGQGTILLVLDAGALAWDRAADRFTDESVVPPALQDAFSEEPRWLDLRWFRESPSAAADPRFAEALADLSAPIRNIERDELIGEDLAQHRKVRRLARAAVTLLVLLLIAAIVASVIAVRQRDDVIRQATTLRSRQLASTATGLLDSDLRLAQLLAVQAYRTEDSPATRQALLQANLASPSIQRVLTFDSEVTALAASLDGTTVAAGLEDGRVFTIGSGLNDEPVLRLTTPGRITGLRANKDGSVLLTQSGESLIVWTSGSVTKLPTAKSSILPDSIALSSSGRRAAAVLEDDPSIVVYDAATGRRMTSHDDPLSPREGGAIPYRQFTQNLKFLNDRRLRLVSNDARWVEFDVETGTTGANSWVQWTPYSHLYESNHRLDFLLAAPINNGAQVSAWPLNRATRNRSAPLEARLRLVDPLGLSVSPGGRYLLVNDASDGLSAAPLVAAAPRGAEDHFDSVLPTNRIPGVTGVTAMEFLTADSAVVAARSEVVFLRFGGAGRGVPGTPLAPRGLSAVSGHASDRRSSLMSVSPDGNRLAVLETSSSQLEIVALPGRPGQVLKATQLGDDFDLEALMGPVWLDDATVLVLGSGPGGPASGLPAGVLRWNLGLPEIPDDPGSRELPIAAQPTADGAVLIAVSDGTVQARNKDTGALLRESDTRLTGAERFSHAAFSTDGRHVAFVDAAEDNDQPATTGPGSLRIVEIASGAVVHERALTRGSPITAVTIIGSEVLITHEDGAVEVLPDLGRGAAEQISTLGTRSSTGSAQRSSPVLGAGGVVGIPTRSGLQLYELASLQPSTEIPAPPGFEAVPRTYAFAPDGNRLITGYFGADARTAVVTVQDLGVDALVQQACSTGTRWITGDEWQRVIGDAPPEAPGCP